MSHGRLVGAIPVVVVGEAVSGAHRVVHVQDRVGGRPRVLAGLEPVVFAHGERAVLVEHRVQAGQARAALKPHQYWRVAGTGGGREEPEEHVGIERFVHGQVTGVTLHRRGVFQVHPGFRLGLADLTVAYHGRQEQGAAVVGVFLHRAHDDQRGGDEQRRDEETRRPAVHDDENGREYNISRKKKKKKNITIRNRNENGK